MRPRESIGVEDSRLDFSQNIWALSVEVRTY